MDRSDISRIPGRVRMCVDARAVSGYYYTPLVTNSRARERVENGEERRRNDTTRTGFITRARESTRVGIIIYIVYNILQLRARGVAKGTIRAVESDGCKKDNSAGNFALNFYVLFRV